MLLMTNDCWCAFSISSSWSQAPALLHKLQSYSGFTWATESQKGSFSLDLAMSSWADHAQLSYAVYSTAVQLLLGLFHISLLIFSKCRTVVMRTWPEKLDWNNLLCDSVINGRLKLKQTLLFSPYFTHILQHSSQFLVCPWMATRLLGHYISQPPLQLSGLR